MRSPNRGSIRSGHTLVELLMAMVGAGVLMVGLSSTMFIALAATDTSNAPTAAILEGHAALSDLLSDLEFALSLSETTANAVTFTVPDRDGDSNPETIRYAWSGTPGDPLTIQYNGGIVATLADNVHVFQHDLPTPDANLLSNPGMESGVVDWEALPDSSVQSDSEAHSGSASLYHLRWDSTGENGVRQDVTSQILTDVTYDVSVWLFTYTSGGPYEARIRLRTSSTGDGEQVFLSDPTTVTTTGTWVLIQGSVTPSWSGGLTSAYFEAISDIQEVNYDDATLRVQPTVWQHVNVSLQIGSNSQSLLHGGKRLINSPL
jgi:hypothetical protein